MDSVQSSGKAAGAASRRSRSAKQQKRAMKTDQEVASAEMIEAVNSLDGPARPIVTSDEEDNESSVTKSVQSPISANARDDKRLSSESANDDGTSSSDQLDWDSDGRSVASTIVQTRRKPSHVEEININGVLQRLQIPDDDDDEDQQHRLAQQHRYSQNLSTPRNIYDAALRREYSNNYDEQSFVSTGENEADSFAAGDKLDRLNLNSDNETDEDDADEDSKMTAVKKIVDADVRSQIVEQAKQIVSDDELGANASCVELSSSGTDLAANDMMLAKDVPESSSEPIVPSATVSDEPKHDGPDEKQSVCSMPDDAKEPKTAEVAEEAEILPVEQSSVLASEEPQKHEWIDIFGTGDLLKKTFYEDPHASRKISNVRPQHRSLCLISYTGYVQTNYVEPSVITSVYDADSIDPEKAAVFRKLEQPKRIVVGEADEIPAIDIVIRMMRKSEKVRAIVKPRFAYGGGGNTQFGINGTSTLIFDIELIEIVSIEPPEATDEYRDKPDKLLDLCREKKEAGNRWYAMHMNIPAVTAWEAGIQYADAALAAMPNYLLNNSDAVDVDKLREQLDTLKSFLYSNMSLAQMNQHSFGECLRSCEKALKINPDSIKCLVRMGKVLGRIEKHKEAVDVLREAKAKVANLSVIKPTATSSVVANEEKEKWRKEIDELLLHSSAKVEKETKQEKELFKRMLGGLSPQAGRNPKKISTKTTSSVKNCTAAASTKKNGFNSSESGADKNFFDKYRNIIVAGSFVAITVGVIASAYFLKHK